MSPRNFIILAVVTFVTVAGAVFALHEQPATRQALQPEEPVFPLLQARLNDAAKLEVVTAEGEVVLLREEGSGTWTLPGKQGYPARQNGVREVILDLRALKVAEPKTRKPEGFARLEVEDVEAEDAQSRLVRVSAADGTVLAEALFGRDRPGALGDASGGIYYRVLGEAGPGALTRTAWLARPRGIRYEAPLRALAAQVKGPVSVWRKQMVLGPAPEFALLGGDSLALDLPEGWNVHYVERRLLQAGRTAG